MNDFSIRTFILCEQMFDKNNYLLNMFSIRTKQKLKTENRIENRMRKGNRKNKPKNIHKRKIQNKI